MFEPENDLERSLVRVANDPAYWPDFLLSMFNGQAFVPVEVDGELPQVAPDGRVTIPPGTKLVLRTVRAVGQEYVPFFSALSRAKAHVRGNPRAVVDVNGNDIPARGVAGADRTSIVGQGDHAVADVASG